MPELPDVVPFIGYWAVAAGARVLSEEDGERRLYRAEDPEGHRWMIAQA